jgi:dihydrofolate reductase
MGKIIVSNLVSIDGYFEGVNKELDWFVIDDEFLNYARELVCSVDMLLFGRKTYEHMAAYWPNAKDNDPVVTDKMNNLPKIVFSKTLSKVEWNNSKLIKEITPEEINTLKQQPGKDLVLLGSGEIVSAFTQLGLIDEYRLIVNPVILGKGNPLFKGLNKRTNLKLNRTMTLGSGVVILFYNKV